MFDLLCLEQGLSQYLETGCPNRGFIDFYVSNVWYKVHTTRVAYRYSGIDRNRDSFRKEPVFYRFVENRY